MNRKSQIKKGERAMLLFEVVEVQRLVPDTVAGEGWRSQKRVGLFKYGRGGIKTLFTIPISPWRLVSSLREERIIRPRRMHV